MNKNLEQLLYEAGLTAQGCWDEFDDYAREGIEKFAKLIVKECLDQVDKIQDGFDRDGVNEQALGAAWAGLAISRHFDIE